MDHFPEFNQSLYYTTLRNICSEKKSYLKKKSAEHLQTPTTPTSSIASLATKYSQPNYVRNKPNIENITGTPKINNSEINFERLKSRLEDKNNGLIKKRSPSDFTELINNKRLKSSEEIQTDDDLVAKMKKSLGKVNYSFNVK